MPFALSQFSGLVIGHTSRRAHTTEFARAEFRNHEIGVMAVIGVIGVIGGVPLRPLQASERELPAAMLQLSAPRSP